MDSSSDIIDTDMAGLCRPTTFSEMVGQPFAAGVGSRIGRGVIAQRYILSGPRGCGKTSLARIIAKSVNCENRDDSTGDPCNSCPSCEMIDAQRHPYVSEINAASRRGIADIRETLSTMSLAVNKGMRVYILDEVHMLTREAFSVLLKPMEEPPENVMFLATTTHPDSIPDTIVSRCAVIPILPLTDEELRRVLVAVRDRGMTMDSSWSEITDGDIDSAVLSASGSARQAITTLTTRILHGVPSSEPEKIEEIVSACVKGSSERVLSLVSEVLASKTMDPSHLVLSMMNGMFSALDEHHDPDLVTRIAALSCVEVSLSTPAVIAAGRIAACITPPTARDWPADRETTAPATSPKEVDKVQAKSVKTTDQKKTSAKTGKTVTSPKKSNTSSTSSYVAYPLYVDDDTTIDEVIDILVDSEQARSVIPKRWRDIIDDESRSDIEIRKGTVIIEVDDPDPKLEEKLRTLVTPLVFQQRNDPPF